MNATCLTPELLETILEKGDPVRVLFTPEAAQAAIDSRVQRKTFSRTLVAELSKSLREGKWVFTGDAIKFYTDGTVAEGQHRLAAVVDSGIAMDVVIVPDVDLRWSSRRGLS